MILSQCLELSIKSAYSVVFTDRNGVGLSAVFSYGDFTMATDDRWEPSKVQRYLARDFRSD
jgi:hypothetical protein